MTKTAPPLSDERAHIWNASDLSLKRTSILAEAEAGLSFVRATTGSMLVLTRADRFAFADELPRVVRLLGSATRLRDESPSISALGELAFAADWSLERRTQLSDDVSEVCLHAVAAKNTDEIWAFLDASQPRPASGVIDPDRIEAIFAPDR